MRPQGGMSGTPGICRTLTEECVTVMKIDERLIELLKIHNKQGPRYTSYPTAPLFSKEYDDRRFEVDATRNNHDNPGPLSLYLHIPFCDTLCYFCGCTTVITRNRERITQYLDVLKKEITKTAAMIGTSRPVTQMAWGGGTPSYLTPSEITGLMRFLHERFRFETEAEISVEIDPRDLTFDHMRAFRDGGVNRVSIGVQDFDENVQKAVNRIQPEFITAQSMEWARQVGIGSINVDLIYGLPLQTVDTFQRTLDRVVKLLPERIAVFNFAYIPWMKPHQNLMRQEEMPDPDTKLHQLKATIETLTEAGYEYIGMDHFARPDDELAVAQHAKKLHRNFQGYSTRAGADLYAFGMSAISHFGDVYAQNQKTLHDYSESVLADRFPVHVGYKMSKDDILRKFVIMRLMCDLEIDKTEVEELFRIKFETYFAASMDQLFDFERQGLVWNEQQRIVVTESGRLILRNLAMCFDAHLNRFKGESPVFSKTV